MIGSCFYEGSVAHRRAEPALSFRYPLALAYLDLDELPGLLGGRLVRPGFGALRFRRSDYLGDPQIPLDEAVRQLVHRRTGRRPSGPIRVLCGLRSFGTCFNPVSFYYCMTPDADAIEALVAEVTNTPWGERHAYVLTPGDAPSRRLDVEFPKVLHVSPFMGMDHNYTCRTATPGPALGVHVESRRNGQTAFDASLSLRRVELSRASLTRHAARFPFAGLRILALIYGNALRLKLRGARYFPHPHAGAAS